MSVLRLVPAGWLAALLVTASLAAPVQGQNRNAPTERVRGKGTVTEIGRGALAVKTEDGDTWILNAPDAPHAIRYVASADPSWLRNGMMVRFVAYLNKAGKAQSPLRQLEVFTPREGDELGIQEEASGSADLSKLFSGEPETEAKEPEYKRYRVAGRLMGISRGRLQVATGRARLQMELDDKARISVNISDARATKAGDKVEFEARYYKNQPGRGWASNLAINAQDTLQGAKRNARPQQDTRQKADHEQEKKDDDG